MIDNKKISTKDFMDYINKSKINPEIIKANIDNNVIEQLLTQLVSTIIIDLEINDLSVRLNDINLANKITNQEVKDYLNARFGRFGKGSATETARSWVKELVRYGMVKPVDKDCDEIEVTAESWSSGKMNLFQIKIVI